MGSDPAAGAAVLVTGASRGLGRGIAEALPGAGRDVAIHYARQRPAAEEALAACRARAARADQRFMVVGGDVAGADDRRRMAAESMAGRGRIYALVNDAGIGPRLRPD